MPKVDELVEIRAPVDRVWAVVHEDLARVPTWSPNLRSVELLDDGPPGKGSHLQYVVAMPGGGSATLEVEQTVWKPGKECSGDIVDGPIKGTWAYVYRHAAGVTTLRYTMDFRLGGVLRFAGGLIADQYAKGLRENLDGLRRYVEAGKGPKAAKVTKG